MARLQTIQAELRYEIVRKLAEGGMGVVYEARQSGARGFAKHVAIKVIREELTNQPGFLENFIGEAKLVADLVHTNIVQTYLLRENGTCCFICMELIRGVNLEELLRRIRYRQQALPVDLAIFIVSRVVRGLAYAHARTDREGHPLGIVHRDVSLRNVMIAFEGDVKLTDFGVAKARGLMEQREGNEVRGKPEYMSPEQADFQVTDRRSDIFSAGVVLSELLLGRNIFRGTTPEESRQRILRASLPDFGTLQPQLGGPVNAMLHRAMSRHPDDRYPTADEFLVALERSIYGSGYGPTNEKLGQYLRDLFPRLAPAPAAPTPSGGAAVSPARLRTAVPPPVESPADAPAVWPEGAAPAGRPSPPAASHPATVRIPRGHPPKGTARAKTSFLQKLRKRLP
ncbi:MAG: protein kinase domain-containing protein [Verrucomicrobiota bacterium]